MMHQESCQNGVPIRQAVPTAVPGSLPAERLKKWGFAIPPRDRSGPDRVFRASIGRWADSIGRSE
jgi:hypothetical protein